MTLNVDNPEHGPPASPRASRPTRQPALRAFQAFWNAVEARLTSASAEELRAILRALARSLPASERPAFLAALSPSPTLQDEALAHALDEEERLLLDITAQSQALGERMEDAAEWEAQYDWRDDEAGGPEPYEAFVAPVTALFERTQRVFEQGHFPLAREAWRALFQLLEREDDYGRGLRPEHFEQVDLSAARAGYLRAVYLTTPSAQRPGLLLDEMDQASSSHLGRPMLEELLALSPEPLPDFEAFLRDWEALLRQELQEVQRDADVEAWLREAIRLARGAEGLRELARSGSHPRAWVELLGLLEREDTPRAVLDTAREALHALPADQPRRATVADFLASAATRLGLPEQVREARWEAFVACPRLSRLLELRESVDSEPERARLMKRAARQVEKALTHRPPPESMAWEEDPPPRLHLDEWLLTHARLLAHEWEAAWKRALEAKPLGWSSSDNPQGLVVPFLLLLSGRLLPEEAPPNVRELWRTRMENSLLYETLGSEDAGPSLLERLARAQAEVLSSLSVSAARRKELLEGCLEVAQQRVSAIVSQTFRRSYGKAALLLVACAEVLQLQGEPARAAEFLTRFRHQFPRHTAFRSELDAALRRG